MALKVKKAVLWKRDLENRPGTLAESLKPFADAKQNLQVVMGYAYPGERNRSALEVYPVSGAKGEAAARQAGLEAMTHTNCLMVEGDDKVGLGYAMANELSANNVNISFSIIQVVGGKFLAIFGFESSDDADKAASIIKAVGAAAGKKAGGRRKAGKTAAKGTKKTAGKRKSAKKTGASKTTAKKAGAKKKTTAKKAAPKKKVTAKKRKTKR
jgi:predicted amino acid-binding ACT domain protein